MAAEDNSDFLELEEMEHSVDKLISALSRPIFIFRMSRANPKMSSRAHRNAMLEIDRIAKEYGADS
jgi:hypothetical protein